MNNVNEQTIYFAKGSAVFKRDVRPGMREVRVSWHGEKEGSREKAEEFAAYLNKIKREQLLGRIQ